MGYEPDSGFLIPIAIFFFLLLVIQRLGCSGDKGAEKHLFAMVRYSALRRWSSNPHETIAFARTWFR